MVLIVLTVSVEWHSTGYIPLSAEALRILGPQAGGTRHSTGRPLRPALHPPISYFDDIQLDRMVVFHCKSMVSAARRHKASQYLYTCKSDGNGDN